MKLVKLTDHVNGNTVAVNLDAVAQVKPYDSHNELRGCTIVLVTGATVTVRETVSQVLDLFD